MKSIFLIFIFGWASSSFAQTPGEFEEKYKKEVAKIDNKLGLLACQVKLKLDLKQFLKTQQKAGNLQEYLSVKKFIEKLGTGDFTKASDDLKDSKGGQEIYKKYQEDLLNSEKSKKEKLNKLLISFHSALKRKVVALTKAGKIEEAVEFQKLEQKYADSVNKLPKETKSSEKPKAPQKPQAVKAPAVWISRQATYTVSSIYKHLKPKPELLTLSDVSKLEEPQAFHTKKSSNPYIIIDLKKIKTIDSLSITNHKNPKLFARANGLTIWLSFSERFSDSSIPVMKAGGFKKAVDLKLPHPTKARYIKLGLSGKSRILHLANVKVMGWE